MLIDLNKIKKYKLYIAWLFLFLLAIFFHFVEKNLPVNHITRDFLPYASFRDTCIAVLIIGFIYEWWIREEALKAIYSATFYDSHIMRNILDMKVVEKVVCSGLQRLLMDDEFGMDMFRFIMNRTFNKSRWYNYRFDITLIQLDNNYPDNIRIHYYDAIIDVRYNRILNSKYLNFIITDNIEDYNKSLENKDIEWRWLFPDSNLLKTLDNSVFNLEKCWIDSNLIIPEIKHNEGKISFRIPVPKQYINTKNNIELRYKIRIKVQRLSHFITANIIVPTHGVTYSLDFARTDITYVNVHDVLASPSIPQIHRLPENKNWHKIEVSIDDWVIPKSGVTFSWVLKCEQDDELKNNLLQRT